MSYPLNDSRKIGLRSRVRTCDPQSPRLVRYLTALYGVNSSYLDAPADQELRLLPCCASALLPTVWDESLDTLFMCVAVNV
jgi:hypothetical protein